jgi:UDP-glucuronate 4-epimerase
MSISGAIPAEKGGMYTDGGEARPAERIVVTGAAGFIGYHVALRLLERGDEVTGIDSMNDYYDVTLKEARLERLAGHDGFRFIRADLAEDASRNVIESAGPSRIIHLAAQAGVRYSLVNPYAYVDSNIRGFLNVLEASRSLSVRHLVYASSSSVYGVNTKQPFSEHDNVDHPISLYAATKKSNELMAHVYAHLYSIPCTGLRFFTVYGPWGRPDMALFRFTRGILRDEPIPVYNYGKMVRDFTYIDDVVEGVVRVLDQPAAADPGWSGAHPDPATSHAPYRVFNIGNHRPVQLLDYVTAIENCVGKTARKELLPLQPGDVTSTEADVSDLHAAVGFQPQTPIEEGIRRFVAWYLEYYGSQ